MNDGNHPYAGAAIAIATLHGKAGALAPAFAAVGVRLVPADDVDTDALGTFSGEIPRRLPPLDTAIEKARLGMRATGLPLGLATEGSFGPDPVLGFVPLHREIAVLVDDTRGLVIAESLASHETNLAGRTIAAVDALDDAELARWKFPSHALIVRAEPAGPDVRFTTVSCAPGKSFTAVMPTGGASGAGTVTQPTSTGAVPGALPLSTSTTRHCDPVGIGFTNPTRSTVVSVSE